MIIFKIKGILREKETGVPLPGLFVKAYDKDLIFDDLLGSGFSDGDGKFDIVSEFTDFSEFLEKKPDIYFKVFLADRETLIHSTAKAVKWASGKISEHEVLIPWDSIRKKKEPSFSLLGEDGKPREAFSAGESLVINATGLQPSAVHEFDLMLEGKSVFVSRFISDRRGNIESTVLWPQMGLADLESEAVYSPAEAAKRWEGRTFSIEVRNRKSVISTARFRFSAAMRTPSVISSHKDGRVLNSFVESTQPLYITMYNLPFGGQGRVYMVPSQQNWNAGDPIAPAQFAGGKPAVRDIELREGGEQQTIEFASPSELLPGSYDFIIRPVRYGFEEDEIMAVLPTDIIGARRATGVVIRLDFWKGKPVLGGCVNKIPMSGAPVQGGHPYFRYRDTFTIGEDVWAGMDPGIVDPGNLSKALALYVIQSKDGPAWANNSLTHLAALGGNPNTTKRMMQPGCMNYNMTLLWPGANIPGDYDIVADFGNNSATIPGFVPDDAYNTPLDCIDGYFEPGFKIVQDPGTMSEWANTGNWNYIQTDMAPLGLPGTVNVQDESGSYATPGAFVAVNRQLRMKANVFFPADAPGITNPAQISVVNANYPLIVIIHGNGHNYTAYDFLLQHFARNGFIAASIDVRYFNGVNDTHGMSGLGRANALWPHLTVLQTAFGATLQNNIGIMGHSRGGEGVLKAARLNQQLALGHNINAVISLAPTDQYGTEVHGGAWATPYFVLYGSRDGDITGGIWTGGYTVPQTGFALYDRASGAKKSMAFVYRATHNGFITNNNDAPWDGDVIANMEPIATQQAVTLAYMNAFFRWHLKNEPQWDGMFKGEWKPGSVTSTGVKLFTQYRDTSVKTVDDFQGALNWQASSIGGTVSHNGTLPVNPTENKMSAAVVAGLDAKSPHDTQGMNIRWDNNTDLLEFTIPLAHKNVSAYSVLSFRITQRVDSASNPANQSQDLRVALKDTANNERAVKVASFYDVPFPDHRPNHAHSKSAMCTVRIPLKSYTIVCAGQVIVDLTNIALLTFKFSEKVTGEIEIDEIEFSN